MTQCGRLFEQLEGMSLEGVLVKTKYDKADFNFSKAIIDFRRHLLLGSNTIIKDNVECELIPMYNVNRISLMREGGSHTHLDHVTETQTEQPDEEVFHE